ncbi:MAG: hypothetical protein RDU13_03950 [Elusimicrobiales bacterium]|nr:hypothetical protein [Elusimicrobiales bacterium]
MEPKNVFLAIAAAALVLQTAPCAAGGDYFSAAGKIAAAAEAGGFRRIAVLDFAVNGPATRDEARYIAEKLSHYLAARKGLEIIERALLDRVLGEQRLRASAGGSGAEAAVFSVDAVVTGTLFSDELDQSVVAKLLEVRTGRVVASFEIKAERRWEISPRLSRTGPETRGLPQLPDFYLAPPDLRDAPAAPVFETCSERRRDLADANRALLELKARYWALKMREPGFDRRRLTVNPGSELGDRGLKKEFYSLLRAHFDADEPPPFPNGRCADCPPSWKRRSGCWTTAG